MLEKTFIIESLKAVDPDHATLIDFVGAGGERIPLEFVRFCEIMFLEGARQERTYLANRMREAGQTAAEGIIRAADV